MGVVVKAPAVDDRDVMRIAAETMLDVRTVRRYLGGAPPRSRLTAEQIEAAMVRLGIKVRAKGKKR